MDDNSSSALNKDVFCEIKNSINDNLILNNAKLSGEISIATVQKVFTNNFLTSRERIQILANLKAAIEATKIFKLQQNIRKQI